MAHHCVGISVCGHGDDYVEEIHLRGETGSGVTLTSALRAKSYTKIPVAVSMLNSFSTGSTIELAS